MRGSAAAQGSEGIETDQRARQGFETAVGIGRCLQTLVSVPGSDLAEVTRRQLGHCAVALSHALDLLAPGSSALDDPAWYDDMSKRMHESGKGGDDRSGSAD